ncbi:MAG: hypothetical protein K2L90_05080 [Muribaculaceae bacterium]|nr:hypothetical protein [Muribaculaceae bacterium]
MTGALFINGQDAWLKYGVRMYTGFIDALEALLPLKPNIENKSRLKNGKQIVPTAPKLDERGLTLGFTIQGNNPQDFRSKKAAFTALLYAGSIVIEVPSQGNTAYHLTYKVGGSYGQNREQTFCHFTAKFEEPDPSNRT